MNLAVIEPDWSGVPARVAALAAHPRAGEVFGAGGHGWQLRPPLTRPEVAALESQLGVALPVEYQSFLLEVSRGGAGPAYGLFPVVRTGEVWQWEGDGAELTDRATLARPFAYTGAVNPVDGLPGPPQRAVFGSEAAFAEAEIAYWEHREAVAFAPEHSAGLLYLCHVGCALREALVVSGPARGQMWSDDTAGDGGYRPLVHADGSRLGFAGWYRRWLDAAERQVHR